MNGVLGIYTFKYLIPVWQAMGHEVAKALVQVQDDNPGGTSELASTCVAAIESLHEDWWKNPDLGGTKPYFFGPDLVNALVKLIPAPGTQTVVTGSALNGQNASTHTSGDANIMGEMPSMPPIDVTNGAVSLLAPFTPSLVAISSVSADDDGSGTAIPGLEETISRRHRDAGQSQPAQTNEQPDTQETISLCGPANPSTVEAHRPAPT